MCDRLLGTGFMDAVDPLAQLGKGLPFNVKADHPPMQWFTSVHDRPGLPERHRKPACP
jgi:hypothetical protein